MLSKIQTSKQNQEIVIIKIVLTQRTIVQIIQSQKSKKKTKSTLNNDMKNQFHSFKRHPRVSINHTVSTNLKREKKKKKSSHEVQFVKCALSALEQLYR